MWDLNETRISIIIYYRFLSFVVTLLANGSCGTGNNILICFKKLKIKNTIKKKERENIKLTDGFDVIAKNFFNQWPSRTRYSGPALN